MAERKPPVMMGPRRGMGEKAKNFKQSIKNLLIYLKAYKWGILIALIFAAMGTVFGILGPKIMEKITTQIILGLKDPIAGINFAKITTIALWLIALYLVSFVFATAQGLIMSQISARISQRFRNDISAKINRLPLKYFDKTTYGDVLSRVTNDVDTIGHTLNQSLSSLITSITTLVGVIVMMFTISWQLTLIALASIPVSMGLIMLVVRFSQRHFKQQQDSLGQLNGHIEEVFSAHNVVKVFNAQDKERNKFNEINKKWFNSAYKAQFLSGLMFPAMTFVGNLTFVFVCVVGGVMSIDNPLFIGSIIAFVAYVKQLNQPISQLANVTNTLQSTAAAAERVFEFLGEQEEPAETDKTKTIKSVKGKVEFKDVCFGYDKDKEIIHHFNFVANPGEKIAIVGPTGAGKTTLVNLLMRFYEVDSGQILIDGVDSTTLSRSYVRSLFAMVLQDTWLFAGTIKENIAYGNKNATDEQIINACKQASIHHFITTLPDGYNMRLEEENSLSAGQKQLFTIARAMVQNAKMLILDEATSSVDTRTEVLISQAMDKLLKNHTSFIIAHRLSTIKNADKIIVMNMGKIVEVGTHQQLLDKHGFYYDLYNSQFNTEEE